MKMKNVISWPEKTEDGDENDEHVSDDAKGNPSTDVPNPEKGISTPAEIEKQKRRLLKTLKAFEDMLDRLATDPKLISNRLTVQTVFILKLMSFACTKNYLIPDGSSRKSVRLMHITPESKGNCELIFSRRAGRILKIMWIGGIDAAPLVDHLHKDTLLNRCLLMFLS